jgi:hypothetical protein
MSRWKKVKEKKEEIATVAAMTLILTGIFILSLGFPSGLTMLWVPDFSMSHQTGVNSNTLQVNYNWKFDIIQVGAATINFNPFEEEIEDPIILNVSAGRNRVLWQIKNPSMYGYSSRVSCVFVDSGGNCSLRRGQSFPNNGAQTGYVNMSGNLVLYHLDETAYGSCPGGLHFCDSSGGGYHASVSPSRPVLARQGMLNYSIELNATPANYLYVAGDPPALELGTQPFSISYWIKAKGHPGDYQTIVHDGGAGTTGFSNLIRNSDYKISFSVQDNVACSATLTSNTALSPGVWTMHTIVFNRTHIILYWNGNWEKNTAWPCSGSISRIDDLTIGSFRGLTWFLNASLDEFALWNRSLSASEVSAIYDSQRLGFGYVEANYTLSDRWASFEYYNATVPSDGTLNLLWSNDSKVTWNQLPLIAMNGTIWFRLNMSANQSDVVVRSFGADFFNESVDSIFATWNGTEYDSTYSQEDLWFVCEPTQKNCSADRQTDSRAIINITNNGSASFYPYLMINNSVSGIDIFCGETNIAGGKTLPGQVFVKQSDVLLQPGNYKEIWCWANYTNPSTGMLFDTFTKEG